MRPNHPTFKEKFVVAATPSGRAVAAIMATLAELKLELGRERRAASRKSRPARQLPATKPPKLSPARQEQLRRLAATGEPVHELAAPFGIGRATAYRYLSHQNLEEVKQSADKPLQEKATRFEGFSALAQKVDTVP